MFTITKELMEKINYLLGFKKRYNWHPEVNETTNKEINKVIESVKQGAYACSNVPGIQINEDVDDFFRKLFGTTH